MFLAYFDESGDTGLVDTPTSCFVLAGVLVAEQDWLPAIDDLTRFRRFLKIQFGIKHSDELRASDLIRSRGPFSHLSPHAAIRVYELCMRFQARCKKLRTFAVAIDKGKLVSERSDVRDTAWTYAIQRIERTSSHQHHRGSVRTEISRVLLRAARRLERFCCLPTRLADGTVRPAHVGPAR